jgi:putative phage-type endonuclease
MTRKLYQDSDEWREERRGGYGASDAPILIEGDEAAWQQLHGEKLGIVPGRVVNEAMEWGKRLEDVIARAYAEKAGIKLRRVNRLVRHREYPYIFASLDRMQNGNRPVEVKKWGFKSDAFGPEGSDIVPTSWLYQVQQQMAVTGADAVDIAVLFAGSKLEAFTVGRDESLITEVVGLEVAAWAFVQRGEMPPWPGQAPKRIIIAEDEIEVDELLQSATLGYEEVRAQSEHWDARLDDWKGRIRELLADAGGAKGVLPDGRRVTIAYRPQADRESVAWELVAKAYRKAIETDDMTIAEHLDDVESMFTTTKPGIRPLRITIGKDTK